MIERRRHHDSTPRCTYAQGSMIDNCKLVRNDSPAHHALLALNWQQLTVDGSCALLRAPDGFVALAVERLPV